jgi:hypothetical protein
MNTEQSLVTDQVGNTKQFIDMMRPLMTAEMSDITESLIALEMRSFDSMGTLSEIVKLQKREIITEIANRN